MLPDSPCSRDDNGDGNDDDDDGDGKVRGRILGKAAGHSRVFLLRRKARAMGIEIVSSMGGKSVFRDANH